MPFFKNLQKELFLHICIVQYIYKCTNWLLGTLKNHFCEWRREEGREAESVRKRVWGREYEEEKRVRGRECEEESMRKRVWGREYKEESVR